MKILAFLLMLLPGLDVPVFAAEEVQSSRSAGKLKLDQDTELSQLIEQSEPVSKTRSVKSENYTASVEGQQYEGVANRYDQLFEIYDADVQTFSDLDNDGYHHAINVYFDVDVSYAGATVYAKLYLSREGEPWSQYFTTDLFSIYLDDVNDAYEVETELLEGYEPGYYAVLVEIYSLDHAYMVASEVLDYHYLGRDVMIEDRSWDEPYAEPNSHGGGSMTTLLLFFLIIQVVIAARGALALSPSKNER
jgi:hypothetical protein